MRIGGAKSGHKMALYGTIFHNRNRGQLPPFPDFFFFSPRAFGAWLSSLSRVVWAFPGSFSFLPAVLALPALSAFAGSFDSPALSTLCRFRLLCLLFAVFARSAYPSSFSLALPALRRLRRLCRSFAGSVGCAGRPAGLACGLVSGLPVIRGGTLHAFGSCSVRAKAKRFLGDLGCVFLADALLVPCSALAGRVGGCRAGWHCWLGFGPGRADASRFFIRRNGLVTGL